MTSARVRCVEAFRGSRLICCNGCGRKCLLFAEDEVDGEYQTEETCDVIPAQRLRLHEKEDECREDGERDDLLNHLELPDRKGTAELKASQPAGRHEEPIFEQRDAPAQKHDRGQSVAFEPRFESDLTVPSEGHKGVRNDKQSDSGESSKHSGCV